MTPLPSHLPSVGELARLAVEAAVQAPSSHNSQPWRFRLAGTRLELHADPGRHLTVIDPAQRQLVISCGCALYNARLAIRAAGVRDEVTVTAGRHPPNLLATIELGRAESPRPDDLALARAIPDRHTNRRAFLPRPVAESVTTPMIDAARAAGVGVVRLVPAQKQAIGELVDAADRAQYADPEFLAELGRWLASPGSARRDGIPFVEKEYGSALPFTVMRALRSPDLGESFAAHEAQTVNAAPVILVMGTAVDEPVDWLRCGEVLEATLLRATILGLSASFLNQALEIPALRQRVAEVVPQAGTPHMILRLGVAEAGVRREAPRRSVDDVLEIAW